MPAVPPDITLEIQKLLEDGSRTLGLRLVFHDRLWRSGLPNAWIHHTRGPCVANLKADEQRCFQYCMRQVHSELEGQAEGRLQTCPWGFTEAAVPVTSAGLFAGILFAGPAWMSKKEPPHSELVCPPHRAWLMERLTVLRALAERLGHLLENDSRHMTSNRRAYILQYLNEKLSQRTTLTALARALHLSPSRVGHLIREEFDTTFPKLVTTLKLHAAAQQLAGTEQRVSEVAFALGFEDPNYFTSVFTKYYGMSPLAYRGRHRPGA